MSSLPPYQPKSTAPASFDLAEAFTALITGDSIWGWLLAWVPLIGSIRFNTAEFCASGPSQTGAVDPEDFLTGSRNPIGQIINQIVLAVKIRNAAYDRVFGAYCERPPAPLVGGWTADICQSVAMNINGANPHGIYLGTAPPGATKGRLHGWTETPPAANYGGDTMYLSNGPTNTATIRYWDGRVWDLENSASVPHEFNIAAGAELWLYMEPGGQGDLCIQWNAPGTGAGFVPTPQPQPTGVLPPTTKVYDTIADLGAELDNLEFKSDITLQHVQYLTQFVAPPETSSDEPIDVDPTAPISLVGAVGFIVTVASIPPGADELFGDPPRYHRIGRVTIGSELGWYPSIDITHNPMLLSPIPPGATKCVVAVAPPTTATVTVLRPPK